MSRMVEIEKRLSMIMEKHRHIVYLVTEDRTILQSVFVQMADTLKGILQNGVDGRIGRILQTANRDTLFRVATTNGIVVDAYEAFRLKEHQFIPEGVFHREEEVEIERQKGNLQTYPVFFFLNDFHIIRESVSAHFLKQFLWAAEREEQEYKRFVLLFLISPILKLPEGFENEMEVIDVPEMDEEDIREYLLFEAKKEYAKEKEMIYQRKIEINVVDQKRIQEAVRDFKGVSSRGIQEITADLQAEFGSFFGRSEDKSGMEGNLNRIRKARKRKIVDLKKEEAKRDSTVTMKEPGSYVAGMEGFLSWIDEIKEEFLDLEKAKEFGNEPPKGVLLTGVPGSGKTQAAKKAAELMGGIEGNVPLVQFRMDNLLGGLVGDSEANFKRCRKRIEALAPCIVLIDEIEKTFDQNSEKGNNDVKMNILTALLDWMQENKKQIFFFATSNSVANLRPELLRDGRFDMRFCVFMPTCQELVQIFELHMKEAQNRAEGRLYGEFDYQETAKIFLKEITAYAREHKKYMFYTGANVVNLITLTNRSLKRKREQENRLGAILQREFQEELIKTAIGGYSQPYGITNSRDIVIFWLKALENQYTNAGCLDLFPFSAYDRETGKFREEDLPKRTNEYDEYLFQCISYEIQKEGKRILSNDSKGREENFA